MSSLASPFSPWAKYLFWYSLKVLVIIQGLFCAENETYYWNRPCYFAESALDLDNVYQQVPGSWETSTIPGWGLEPSSSSPVEMDMMQSESCYFWVTVSSPRYQLACLEIAPGRGQIHSPIKEVCPAHLWGSPRMGQIDPLRCTMVSWVAYCSMRVSFLSRNSSFGI